MTEHCTADEISGRTDIPRGPFPMDRQNDAPTRTDCGVAVTLRKIRGLTFELSAETAEFIDHAKLRPALDVAARLLPQFFKISGNPLLSVSPDPYSGEPSTLMIEATVSGEPGAVSESHQGFAAELASSRVNSVDQIGLVCNIR